MIPLRLGLFAALVSLCVADSEPVDVCRIEKPLFAPDADKPKFKPPFSISVKTDVSEEGGVKVVKCGSYRQLCVLKEGSDVYEPKFGFSMKCDKAKQQWVFVDGDKTTPYAGERVGCCEAPVLNSRQTDPGIIESKPIADPNATKGKILTDPPISKDPVGPIVKPPKEAAKEEDAKEEDEEEEKPEEANKSNNQAAGKSPCKPPRLAKGNEVVIPPHLKFITEETQIKPDDEGVWKLECSDIFGFWDVAGFKVFEKLTWSLVCEDKQWMVRRQGDGKDGGYNPRTVVGCFRKKEDNEEYTGKQPSDKPPCGKFRVPKDGDERIPPTLQYVPEESVPKYDDDGRWKLKCQETIAWYDVNSFNVQQRDTWDLECVGKQWIFRKHSNENDGPLKPSTVVGCFKKKEEEEDEASDD